MSSVTVAESTQEPAEQRWAFLARFPTLGLVLILIGLSAFAVLLLSVETHGLLTQWDVPIDQSLHATATHDPGWLVLMWRGAETFGRELILIACIVLGLYWAWHRHWREVSMLVVGVGGGEPIFEFVSNLVGRHRPVFPTYIEFLPGPGFPSGPCISAVLFYGLMAYLLMPRLRSRGWRILAWVDAVLLILVVGFSRIFVGLHYPTDILAGYAIGLAWGAFVYTGIEINHWCRSRT